ncbi:hypothetical protein IWQ56_003719 [Coemansia nantahalensis]|nr:hypothetical protein IWQ56_003719 [Coemansia nantahalensis]
MEDSLDTYISQSLIDRAGDGVSAGGMAGTVGSELLMQMLLSTMGAGSAEDLPPVPETVDPSSLSAMDIDEYAAAIADTDTADTNSLLAAALLSALGPLPDIAAPTDVPVAASATTSAAVAAPPSSAATRPAPEIACSSAAGPAKPAARQPTPAARGPPPASARRPAPRTSGAPAANHDDDDDDDDDGMEGIDLTNLTSKERRQLRNKISARNFRVRRKEYISNLEAEVRMHKEEADGLRRDLLSSQKDNALLREEIQKLRVKLGALSTSQPTAAATPARAPVRVPARAPAPAKASAPVVQAEAGPPRPVAATAGPRRPPPPKAAPSVLPPAPMVRFNPHKDIPQGTTKTPNSAGPSATAGSWATKDSCSPFVTVNTAVLPQTHVAVADGLIAEMRRKQAVDALLDMGEPTAQPLPPLDAPDLIAALLCAASQTAELMLLQYAIESSFASPPAHMAAPAALSAAAVSC